MGGIQVRECLTGIQGSQITSYPRSHKILLSTCDRVTCQDIPNPVAYINVTVGANDEPERSHDLSINSVKKTVKHNQW